MTAAEQALLREVGELLHGEAAVPQRARQLAYEAIDLRFLTDELAALVADSAVDDRSLVGARGAGPRVLTFEAASLTIEVRVDVAGRMRRLVGQLDPPGALDLEVTVAEHRVNVTADERGRFVVESLPAGSLTLRVQSPSVGTASVTI
jgi:hypothetical protein